MIINISVFHWRQGCNLGKVIEKKESGFSFYFSVNIHGISPTPIRGEVVFSAPDGKHFDIALIKADGALRAERFKVRKPKYGKG